MTTRSSLIAGCLLLGSVAAAATSDTKTQLRLDMRKLWDDHAAYTRSYVISAIAGLPDTDAVASVFSGIRTRSATRSSRTTARKRAGSSPRSCATTSRLPARS